jgi:5'-3' exonuclease
MHEDYESYSSDSEFEDALIASVCRKIDEYIGIVKPRKHVFIAFDGVAPVAKLEQQRNRRYKSSLERSLRETLKGLYRPAMSRGKESIKYLDTFETMPEYTRSR